MRRLNRDTGAVGVFVAITIAVLLGLVGLTIDVGAMYWERRELQNGADAGALAIAEECALGSPLCNETAAAPSVKSLADGNSSDGAAAIDILKINSGAHTVTVRTSTLNDDGTVKFDPFFAEVIGFDGSTIRAEAVAQWGNPSSLFGLPLIISMCEFPGTSQLPSPEDILYFHDGNNAEECNAQAGQDADGDGFLAGGFGWLTGDGDCELFLQTGSWYDADPGSSPSNGCDPAPLLDLVGQDIPLPIFDDLFGVGTDGNYHIAGFAMFHITGFNFGGLFKANPPCSGDERCMSGYFTTGVVYDGEVGGPDTGIRIVKLIG
jgi:hypothetical protein